MNAFAVFAKEQSFEVPIGLFADRSTAEEHAEDVTEEDVCSAIRFVLGIPKRVPLYPASVGLVEFRSGEPQPYEPVKQFADVTTVYDAGDSS